MSTSNVPDFEPVQLLGSGSFGYVVEAYDRTKDIRVAIKRTHKVGTKLSREFDILSQLKNCRYVVRLLDVFYTESSDKKIIQNLVFEFAPKSLEGFIEKYKNENKLIPIENIKIIIKQILSGLNYCHKMNIVHRDLKPENILFSKDENVKICDFGSSKKVKNKSNKGNTNSTPYIVSRYYRAPELLLGKIDYDTKIDIFAAGCILAELFILEPLFRGMNEGLQLFEYINIIGKPDKKYLSQFDLPKNFLEYFETINEIKDVKTYPLDELLNKKKFYKDEDINEACDLIFHMITWDYDTRYTAEECMSHPFLKDVKIKSAVASDAE